MDKVFQYHVIKINDSCYVASYETVDRFPLLTTSSETAKRYMFYSTCANVADWVGGHVETVYK
jgi:hypothetical protein